jgi:hypothetical protein
MAIIRRPIRSEGEPSGDPSAWGAVPRSAGLWLEDSESARPDGDGPPDLAPMVVDLNAPAPSNPLAQNESSSAQGHLGTDADTVSEFASSLGKAIFEAKSAASEVAPEVKEKSDQPPPSDANGEEYWANEVVKAVASARGAGTPDDWTALARAAQVLCDLAQTMEHLAATNQIAIEKEQAAQEAKREAERAIVRITEADRTAALKARAAEEAEMAAQRVAQDAEVAKDHAAKAAEAAPVAEHVAEAALQASAIARKRAEDLEEAVARARQANSPQAWSETLRVVTQQNDADDIDDRPPSASPLQPKGMDSGSHP